MRGESGDFSVLTRSRVARGEGGAGRGAAPWIVAESRRAGAARIVAGFRRAGAAPIVAGFR
ncbi:hypothetical protein GCM10010349_37480 [Streptomyces flavofungini]|nr:hypothetical protein GCM10010349_37480 [Streptomyces flavofungini]